jgi:hypothetical protein
MHRPAPAPALRLWGWILMARCNDGVRRDDDLGGAPHVLRGHGPDAGRAALLQGDCVTICVKQ